MWIGGGVSMSLMVSWVGRVMGFICYDNKIRIDDLVLI